AEQTQEPGTAVEAAIAEEIAPEPVDSTGATHMECNVDGATGSTGGQEMDSRRAWRKTRVSRKQWRSFRPDEN
ncbi:unnamed protein product, partial [Symbiodinium pilosum]